MDKIKAASERQALIQSLASSMGRSEHDVMMLARGIVNDFIKEGLDELFVDSDIDTQSDLVQAYALHQQKKFDDFHMTYLTNPQAAHAFRDCVYGLLNETELSKE